MALQLARARCPRARPGFATSGRCSASPIGSGDCIPSVAVRPLAKLDFGAEHLAGSGPARSPASDAAALLGSRRGGAGDQLFSQGEWRLDECAASRARSRCNRRIAGSAERGGTLRLLLARGVEAARAHRSLCGRGQDAPGSDQRRGSARNRTRGTGVGAGSQSGSDRLSRRRVEGPRRSARVGSRNRTAAGCVEGKDGQQGEETLTLAHEAEIAHNRPHSPSSSVIPLEGLP